MTNIAPPTPEVAPTSPDTAAADPAASSPWFKKKRYWALGAVAIVIIAALAAGGGDDTTTSGSETPAAAPDTASNGQTSQSGDLQITLHAVSDPWESTNEFESPEDGSRFVAVEVSIRNDGGDAMTFSPLLSMQIIDAQSQAWDATFAGADIPSISGDIPVGDTRRGWAVFEVPNESDGLELHVEGYMTGDESVFALS